MKSITLQQVLPAVFAENKPSGSDVWLSEIVFSKGNRYLIDAESGKGKSSLCAYLYGYRQDYSGTIMFDEADIRMLSTVAWSKLRCNSLSMMMQDLRLFPELTAIENILLKTHLSRFKMRDEILSFFEMLGISDKVDAPVSKLSFGQQQRVAFIRMLCQPADFMILDEPVSHLDKKNEEIMLRILLDESTSQGAGVIVTSIGKHFEMGYDKVLVL